MRDFMRTLFLSTAVLMPFASTGHAQEGDAAAGEKLFKRCSVCHTAGADESRRGPSLKGVFGRKAATAPDYPYSEPMREAGAAGLVWDEETLASFIKKSQALVKGTWMAFPGFGKEQDIRDVIAYLRQLNR